MEPNIQLKDINLVYKTRNGEMVDAITNLSVDIFPGEFVSVVGPSGCGKSTLIQLIDGLLKPTSGEIIVNKKRVTGPSPDRAVVFQDFALMPWRDVNKNVLLGPELRGKTNSFKEKAMDTIRMVGLKNFERKYPYQLSGGMKQRAAIARALTNEPEILLMDEPFAAVDAQMREIMQEELIRIWQATGKTVVFITHSIDEAVYMSNRVLLMSARPGRFIDELKIELPYPRTLEVKNSQLYFEYRTHVWEHLKTEVHKVYDTQAS
ncbi:MAG: putative transporter, ATP-binding protein [Chloroflexi bacterium]|jgi:NitT/TauT family transport system ATP-binding protein|nr:putative transporter, ATP-binding protein [Chloroflexota bacterium]